ncbi:MAG: DUF998 domain-containing protein [Brevirhabdus sp.]
MQPLVQQRSRSPREQKEENTLVWSYYYVRQALGWLGFLLPFMLLLGNALIGENPEPSISDFFHSMMRDIMVGSLVAIGIFLLTYKGYENREDEWLSDFWVSTLAGAAAICVALFPTTNKFQVPVSPQNPVTFSQRLLSPEIASTVHNAAAIGFFVCLFLFCWVLFRRFDPEKGIDAAKKRRFVVYKVCGVFIAIAIVGLIVIFALNNFGSDAARQVILERHLIFWFEAVGVWAFGVSWLVKGKAEVSMGNLIARFTR